MTAGGRPRFNGISGRAAFSRIRHVLCRPIRRKLQHLP
jgi:hypothetical protein